jgi:hypothetical protein
MNQSPSLAVAPDQPQSLYAKRKNIQIRSVTGFFSNWRWAMVWIKTTFCAEVCFAVAYSMSNCFSLS